MPEFAVGDLVILQYPDHYFRYDGVHALVIALLDHGAEYWVQVLGGPMFRCEPHQLRRPDFDEEETSCDVAMVSA
ncbi:MAG: hypothetical protein U5S82_19950 [Gammaproteobacteria bacterium]|nr:hypothetical protein [Gammaproteobacteria bacterium]